MTGSNHIFLDANRIRPNNICHEMGHIFGLGHASQAEYNDYGDSYCLMGGLGPAGRNATEFQNSRLIVTTRMVGILIAAWVLEYAHLI